MGNLLNFAVYNPSILSDEDFLSGFVARREMAEKLLNRLREVTLDNVAQHRLLIGQRGMGKTSLLRRIALGILNDPELSKVLLPLSFREEQYNVHNLHVFWSNCLDALGDFFEKEGRRDLAAQVDRDVALLTREGDDQDGVAALETFKRWCDKERKRPILLIDNIDLIFDGLAKQDWTLRRILQEPGGILVIGATCTFLEAAAKVDAPFYDFFQVELLEKVSHDEMIKCLRSLARERGEQGRKVLQLLDCDPARIHTLYDLTGGNPRTLVLLYLLLEVDTNGDVMGDLERLLDQVTVLYKARVEDLPPQSRVVLDAVALNWNPVTVSGIYSTTGIETTSISSQLDRLQKLGIVERVSLSTPAPVGYQLGERFFNIWYLMRNASRRLRNRLRWLTEFLRRFYTPQQLCSMASDFMRHPSSDGRSAGMYGLALADAVADSSLRHALHHFATSQLDDYSREIRTKLEEIVDLSDLDHSTLEMKELKRRVLDCRRDWGSTNADEFWDLLGGSVSLSRSEKQRIVSELPGLPVSEVNRMVNICRDEEAKSILAIGLPDAFNKFRTALREGIIDEPGDIVHALAAANYLGSNDILAVILNYTNKEKFKNVDKDALKAFANELYRLFEINKHSLNSLCHHKYGLFLYYLSLYDEAVFAFRQSIEIDVKNSLSWSSLAYTLHYKLGRYAEAEDAYRKALELNPKLASRWHSLGELLQRHLNRYEEAATAYYKAVELNSETDLYWNSLGNLLQYHLNRYEEAETAYRKAIAIDPEYADYWNNLGILLQAHLKRYEEAETAYRKAIAIDPKAIAPWTNVGILYAQCLSRYEEAEAAFRKAIEIDSKNIYSWHNLGDLLQDLGRYTEAKDAYLRSIEIASKDIKPWNNLGNLLYDHLGQRDEAEKAYGKVLELSPNEIAPKFNLANILFSDPNRKIEAEPYYEEALKSLPVHGHSLLTAFRAFCYDNFGEATKAFTTAFETDDPDLFSNFYPGLMRVLRIAKERGYGEKFLQFMEESGLGERYWPLYAAFNAYVFGEEKLRDVNPEVRRAAQRIYDWLTSNRKDEKPGKQVARKKGRTKTDREQTIGHKA
jgi:tetratricopeptide (TPR) repeat protein